MESNHEIGSYFIIGFEGQKVDSILNSFFKDFTPAGWILFSKNMQSPQQVKELNGKLKILYETIPPFITVDQEGGRVNRLFSKYPSGRDMTNFFFEDKEKLTKLLSNMAKDIKSLGFNTDFAPVADIEFAESEIIGDRAFSDDPYTAAQLVKLFIDIFNNEKILSSVKHFPGHGGVIIDSHKELPMDNNSISVISQEYLPPFIEGIKATVPLVMFAHVIYTEIDEFLPASLSVKAALLLKKTGFSGLSVTDDLYMNAIKDNFSPKDIVQLLLNNHTDLWIVSKNTEFQEMLRKELFDLRWKSEVKDQMFKHYRRIENFWSNVSEKIYS